MQDKKAYSDKLFVSFQLSSKIPKENFYHRLAETLDLSFLYMHTKSLYGTTGHPSLDPVVFFKLMLVGYLENIVSDRRLIEHCSMRMDILYYLGYNIDEELPWYSTLSRTRQLYPASLFEGLFNRVFHMCIDIGMVAGHTQVLDSAPVKANASMESLVLKQPATSVQAHLQCVKEHNDHNSEPVAKDNDLPKEQIIMASEHQLKRLQKYQQNLMDNPVSSPGAGHQKAQLVSNKTHYCPSDPDARISVKPGKARTGS